MYSTWEIKFRVVMAKAEFNKKKTLSGENLYLNLREKPVTCYA